MRTGAPRSIAAEFPGQRNGGHGRSLVLSSVGCVNSRRASIMLGSRHLAMKRASWVDSFAGVRVLYRHRVGWPEVGYHAAGHGLVSFEEALVRIAKPS